MNFKGGFVFWRWRRRCLKDKPLSVDAALALSKKREREKADRDYKKTVDAALKKQVPDLVKKVKGLVGK